MSDADIAAPLQGDNPPVNVVADYSASRITLIDESIANLSTAIRDFEQRVQAFKLQIVNLQGARAEIVLLQEWNK